MTHHSPPSPAEPPQCQQAFERMPWLVNGSLPLLEARELEAHAAGCALCQRRLRVERELFAAIRRPVDNVQQSPLAAWTRFEAAAAEARANHGATNSPAPSAAASPAPATTPSPARRRHPLRLTLALQAAAIALLSMALFWILVARSPVAPPAPYRTVAAPDTSLGAADAAWRVVFDPASTAADVLPLLASRGLRVLQGPSQDGVYTVGAAPGTKPRIEGLRNEPGVRLVERVGTAPTADRDLPAASRQ